MNFVILYTNHDLFKIIKEDFLDEKIEFYIRSDFFNEFSHLIYIKVRLGKSKPLFQTQNKCKITSNDFNYIIL